MSTAGAILVLAATPGRATALREALESSPSGLAVLKALSLDPLQQQTVEGARVALAGGYRDAKDAPILRYLAIAVYGDVPFSARAIADLRAASASGVKFLFIGVADGPEQRAALAAASISQIAAAESLAAEFPDRIGRANAAAKEEEARQAAEVAASRSRVSYDLIEGAARSGLLPNGGIIMVHCNKGGAGKSMLTASIAYGLAQSSPVALADMNTSGGYIHGAFDKWLRMPENGGFRSAGELLDVHGLSVLSNRINHANARKIDPEQLSTAMLKLKPHDARPLNLIFLPGIRSQRDYGIGRTDNTRTPAQELLVRPEWAQELLETLRSTVGGAGYVVLDTGDSEVNAPSSVMFTRSDLIVWVVDCTTWRLVEDEFSHLRRILEEYGGHLRARVLVVANKIASDADRMETPEAPQFQEVRKMFTALASGGSPVEVIPVRHDRRAIVLADNAGLPVLAIADEHPELRLSGDLVELINTINGSMQRNIVAGGPKKKGGLGSLFGKKG